MTPIKARTAASYLFFAFFVAGILGAQLESLLMLVVTGVLFLAVHVCVLWFWRCQSCRRLLPPLRLWGTEYGPHCGEKLK